MTDSSKSKMEVVWGTMTVGKPGIDWTTVHTSEAITAILDVLQKHGHNRVDAARMYGSGTTEEYLGNIDWQARGIIMDTKLYPNLPGGPEQTFSFEPSSLRKGLMMNLKALKTSKVDTWFLHGPDRTVDLEATLREVNNLYKEGFFRRLGISNYASWEVAQICEICDRNGWVKPTICQGGYNPLQRSVEKELIPCLRNYHIPLHAYNPLAGGFLSDRYHRDQTEFEPGSKFDPNKFQGKLHHALYWHDGYFSILEELRRVAHEHSLTESECAIRWLVHHSALDARKGDAIVMGASKPEQLEQNLKDVEKGPLPEDVVQVFEKGWDSIGGKLYRYFH